MGELVGVGPQEITLRLSSVSHLHTAFPGKHNLASVFSLES